MLQTADFDHNDFNQDSQTGQDEKLLVKFYTKARQDKTKSQEEGRPVFKDVEYIDIRIPGSRDSVARPATEGDKQRFPRHYAAFQQRVEMPVEGTPLVEWPQITRSMAEELAFFNCKTVEQLADMSDGHAQQFMGINVLRQKAKDWLEATSAVADKVALQEALSERDQQIESLHEQLQAMYAKLEAIEAAQQEGEREE